MLSIVDIFATIADWAGADLSAMIQQGTIVDSVSLLPYLLDPDQAPQRDFVYTDFEHPLTQERNVAIRDVRYKLHRVLNDPTPDALFDLLFDPDELDDLLLGQLTWEQEQAYFELNGAMAALLNSELE